jgi:hypothetical protein
MSIRKGEHLTCPDAINARTVLLKTSVFSINRQLIIRTIKG